MRRAPRESFNASSKRALTPPNTCQLAQTAPEKTAKLTRTIPFQMSTSELNCNHVAPNSILLREKKTRDRSNGKLHKLFESTVDNAKHFQTFWADSPDKTPEGSPITPSNVPCGQRAVLKSHPLRPPATGTRSSKNAKSSQRELQCVV